MSSSIPRYPLKHREEIVSFAIRTLEEIFDEAQGKVDDPHRHDFYTLIWVKYGEGVHHIDFKEYPILENTIHVIRPGQVHQFHPKDKPLGVAILFTTEFLSLYGISEGFFTNLRLFDDCDENAPITMKEADKPFLEDMSYVIFKELEKADKYAYEVISAHMKLLLIRCQRNMPISHVEQNAGSSLVRNFKELVDQQFTKLHKVVDYSDLLYVTANHLNEVIRSALGLTAKEYIQNRIILEAKREAHFTDLSSKEIAFRLGFDDPAHFSKFFKNCTGFSFSDFRASIR